MPRNTATAMSNRCRLLVWAMLLAITCGRVAATPPPTGRNDRHGEPLPPCAVARLGSMRLRHPESVISAVFSRDGRSLLTIDLYSTVRLWDSSTGKLIRNCGQVTGQGMLLHATANTGRVAAISYSQEIRDKAYRKWATVSIRQWPWDKESKRLELPDRYICAVAFAPGGKRIVLGGEPKQPQQVVREEMTEDGVHTIHLGGGLPEKIEYREEQCYLAIWDALVGKELHRLRGQKGGICQVSLSSDGRLLASLAEDGSVFIWDMSSGKKLRELARPSGGFSRAGFRPGTTTVACGDTDGNIVFFGAKNGKEKLRLNISAREVDLLAFSPDGKILAAQRDFGKRVHLLDAATGKKLAELSSHSLWAKCLAFSPDSRLLVVGSADQTVSIWEMPKAKLRLLPGGHLGLITGIAFSPDGGMLLSSGMHDHAIRFWDVRTGRETRRITAGEDTLDKVAFSPDGSCLASLSFFKSHIHAMSLGAEGLQERKFSVRGEFGSIYSLDAVAFSPDARTVVVGTGPMMSVSELALWDVPTGKKTASFAIGKPEERNGMMQRRPTRRTGEMKFSRAGLLAAVVTERTFMGAAVVLAVYDRKTSKSVCEVGLEHRRPISLCFSHDGSFLAAMFDKKIRVWDPRTGEEVRVISHRDLPNGIMSFSHDGSIIFVGCADGTVRLCSGRTGKPVAAVRGHSGRIIKMLLSPDGQLLATAGEESTIVIWDVTQLRKRGR